MAIINNYTPANFEEGKEKAIENLVDLYTKIFPTNERFYFYNHLGPIIRKDYPDFVNHQTELYNHARQLTIDCGYVKQESTAQVATLTKLGRHVKSIGGHYKYLESLEIEKAKQTEKEKVELDNLMVSNKVNKWLYKTRWLPHVLAVIALAISVAAIIISLNTSDKSDEKKSLKQEVSK